MSLPPLRPHDVAVLLQYALAPQPTYRARADILQLSVGEVHNATRRLEGARLVHAERDTVNRGAIARFVVHGVPFAFPAQPGPIRLGVPTAGAATALLEQLGPPDPTFVWPSVGGEIEGPSIAPLLAASPSLRDSSDRLYQALCLVDAIRIGSPREKHIGRDELSQMIREPDSALAIR